MNETLIIPSHWEIVFGRRYLLFQLIFLGNLLSLGALLLGIPLTPLALNLCYFSVNFLVCLVLFRKFLHASVLAGIQSLRRCLLTALSVFLVYQVLSTLLGSLIVAIDPDFSNVNDQTIAGIGSENLPVMAIGTVLLVPLAEETLHRGLIFGGLYYKNRTAAYLVSTLIFALIHVSGYVGAVAPLTLLLCLVQYVPAGLCLAFAYERSGSILTPILIHTAVNTIGMLAMG